jgi:hypothetical protein
MLDGQSGVKDSRARMLSRSFGGCVAALALALVPACGGMAEGVAPGESRDDTSPASGSSGPASGSGRPSRDSSGGTRSVTCYSPDDLDSSPLLEEVLPFLPRDAFDASGCLAASYSGWLAADGCSYDADGANLRGGQCCYELNDAVSDCARDPR